MSRRQSLDLIIMVFQFIFIIYTLISHSSSEVLPVETPLSSSQLFTFAHPQSFLKAEPGWILPATREVTFQFRTDRPHGLLFYHGSTTNGSYFPFYEVYAMLENGRIKVIHVFHSDGQGETFFIGKGLNRDKWHHITLKINPSTAHLTVRVDENEMTVSLPSLSQSPNYNVGDISPNTVTYFGGLDPNDSVTNQKYNYVRFIGCLGNIMFSSSDEIMYPSKVTINQLSHGYVNQCEKKNPCLYNGHCINHYTHTSCDCYDTGHEDQICFHAHPVTVTLKGYSYITYRVYDWRDRVHSEVTRLSFAFKTYFQNSILMYASGEHPDKNYMAISLSEGKLHFEIDFGDGPLNSTIGYSLNDEMWHKLTILHHGKNIKLKLDSRWSVLLTASGPHHHLHLDPEISIGAAPPNAFGLKSHEKFIGCIRNFYFNEKSVLYALRDGDQTARYHSIFPVEYDCHPSNVIPITFPLPESKLVLTQTSRKKLQLSLEFKTSQANCVLASGEIKTEKGIGTWEGVLQRGIAIFYLNPGSKENIDESWSITDEMSGKHLADDEWHHVAITYDSGDVKLVIDYRHTTKSTFTHPMEFGSQMVITTSAKNAERGFIGCIRDIYVSGEWIDPRIVINTNQVSGKVSLDSCRLVDLCSNPQACEHGGRCYAEKGETYCDCSNTGYTGRTCHFSLYKRTCEELYLVGYRKKGVYIIDIDRNGPLPPAHVYCDMGGDSGTIATKVENNMPTEMVVRKAGMDSFFFDVTYREFTPIMLQSLVKHSKLCFQNVKYECFKTPLGLRTYTWMKSSGSEDYITSIGSRKDGCKCFETQSCANSSLQCNCDIADARWRVDEGEYIDAIHLGITRVYVLQPNNLESTAEGRLTLGPLECVETDTQQYVITFKTPNSYIEVPGWRRGDIAFSFRTSNSQAVLIYQTSIHSTHGYLRVLLVSDYELSFEFNVNNKPQNVKVMSRRRLNSGEWQQVWVDHDTHHMRFTVNLDSEMVDWGEDHGVGPFEGPLFVGGVPEHNAGDSIIREGFIGCFRGLVINDVVVDLYKHMTRSELAIVLGCQPSCASNPCQNGGTCHEYWGSYVCKCINPFAHSGKNCEINVNTNAMTVISPKSFYHHKTEGSATNPVLEQNILLSFRTFEEGGILLYAFDHFNNFVQLHFKNNRLFFTFNSDRTVYQIFVNVPDLSNGFPIQVKVDRSRQQTTLSVNDKIEILDVKMKFVDRYFQKPWIHGQEFETVVPPRGTYQTIDHSEMFLGHVGSGTEAHFAGSFVGCIQGFKIGNEVYDLEAVAETANPEDVYGIIRSGCVMMCDRQPCQNEGLCIELWTDNTTSCDCSLTSYTGDICQKDIGGRFDGESILMYSFDDQVFAVDNVIVRFAFSTDYSNTLFAVLFLVQFSPRKYILVGLSQDHSLFIEESIGSLVTKRIAKTKSSWSDGNRHWLYFQLESDNMIFIVDGRSYSPFIQTVDPSADIFEGSSNMIYIGGLPKEIEDSAQYVNFQGCISNVMVGFGKLQLMPLETAFGYQRGALEKITVIGSVNERKCAEFAQASQLLATLSSIAPPEIQGPEWYPDPPVLVPYKSASADRSATSLDSIGKTSSRVAAVMGALLLVVLFGLLIYIYRIQRRHKKERLGEEYQLYKGSRRPTGSGSIKVVSFSSVEQERGGDFGLENQPLTWTPPTPPAFTTPSVEFESNSIKPSGIDGEKMPVLKSHADAMEMAPLRSTSSQELEWDPTGAQLISTAMEEMNPGDNLEVEELGEIDDQEGPLPKLKNQFAPLASASEVTINRLSQTFA